MIKKERQMILFG